MYEDSIYSDNYQRTLIVGMIQDRIDRLEFLIDNSTDKDSLIHKYNIKELNSLKDFLFFHS